VALWPARLPAPGARTVRAITAGLAICGILTVAFTAVLLAMGARAPLGSDGALFDRFNAALVLRGGNPYTADSQFWTAIREDPRAGATPVARGIYRHRVLPPTLPEIVREVRREAADPALRGPQFDPASLHSYPAMAFLLFVPAVAVHQGSTVITSLVLVLLLLVAIACGCPRWARSAVAVLLAANAALILGSELGGFECAALLPLVLSWRWLDRRIASPALLGAACAVKQIAWPAVPFYLVLVARRDGVAEALRRLVLTTAAFLLPNLPFMLASPSAWAHSMLLPLSMPVFPSGIGIVWPAAAGLVPLLPAAAYSVAEAVGFAVLLVWWARSARPLSEPRLGPLLALLPLLLAWRSLDSYFLAVPALAVFAVLPRLPRYERRPPQPAPKSRVPMIAGHPISQ
jgi:hypothetical protein